MLTNCAGNCGKHIYISKPDKPVYLCGKCYRAWINIMFKIVGRGRDVFTLIKPSSDRLN